MALTTAIKNTDFMASSIKFFSPLSVVNHVTLFKKERIMRGIVIKTTIPNVICGQDIN